MKTLIILFLLVSPCIVFSQSMHLPGAHLRKLRIRNSDSRPRLARAEMPGDSATTADTSSGIDLKKTGITGAPIRYKAAVLNTNFTVPLVRVNFLNNKPQNASNSLVSTSFLNSVGAGLNYSWGELDQTLDANGNDASIDYYNHFGFQLGFLFAANSSSGSSTTTTTSPTTQSNTIFAIVGGISILNFQIGAGYELGSVTTGQKRGFLTISYAIPMSLLINGGYKIYQHDKIKDGSL
jgi:hypothetical protein